MPRKNKRRKTNKKKSSSSTFKTNNSAPKTLTSKSDSLLLSNLIDKHDLLLNRDFYNYYKLQNLVCESEEETFYRSLLTELPTTFWISNSKNRFDHLHSILNEDRFNLASNLDKQELVLGRDRIENSVNDQRESPPLNIVEIARSKNLEMCDGQRHLKAAPSPIKSFQCKEGLDGDDAAWYCNVPKRYLKRNSILTEFRNWLCLENEFGNLTRQELVSMIPPLLLDIQSHHIVLDMCAAPGSKTCQILELLKRKKSCKSSLEGFVVANDSNYGRCHMLVHRIKKLCSPAFIVLNHRAENLRNIYCDNESQPSQRLLFDRILCDVPCSGDGTIRKSPHEFLKQNGVNANSLHTVQLKIAIRAVQLLKNDGLMTYSTCSFNPVENEAVINALLHRFPNELELVDLQNNDQNLVFPKSILKQARKGFKHQKVVNFRDYYEKRKIIKNIDINEFIVNKSVQGIEDTMFDSYESISDSLKNSNSNNLLERCVRFLPHLNDCGGFFIALLRKRVLKEKEEPVLKFEKLKSDNQVSISAESQMNFPDSVFSEHLPFYTLPNLCRDELGNFFGIDWSRFEFENLFFRSNRRKNPSSTLLTDLNISDNLRSIYYVPKRLASMLNRFSNEQIDQLNIFNKTVDGTDKKHRGIDTSKMLTVVYAGLRVFSHDYGRSTHIENSKIECRFRITQEAVDFIFPYISKRVVECSIEEALDLLKYRSQLIQKNGDINCTDTNTQDKNTRRKPVNSFSAGFVTKIFEDKALELQGSIILMVKCVHQQAEDSIDKLSICKCDSPILMSCQRHKTSIEHMIGKNEISFIVSRLQSLLD